MGYYDLTKKERQKLIKKMEEDLLDDLKFRNISSIIHYSSDPDIYIRKNVSGILGRNYRENDKYQTEILLVAIKLLEMEDEKVRQTSVYLLGEIGKKDAERVFEYLETSLRDPNHQVRNAVMSSLKIMGEQNPEPTLKFASKLIHDPDPEVRRKVVHGIELRGRTHPEDILPLLSELQDEKHPQVRKMVIHVLGQISYKKGCLEKVTSALITWHNHDLVRDVIQYIIEVHKRYPFSAKSVKEAQQYLEKNFNYT